MTPTELVALCNAIDLRSKAWWAASLGSRILAIGLGAASTCREVGPERLALAMLALTVSAEICAHRQREFRAKGQGLRRKIEYLDGLGWEIPSAYLSDLLVLLPTNITSAAKPKGATEPYFASQLAVGPARLLDNLCESSWFSKHLADSMANWCTFLSVGVLAVALVTLYAAATATPSHELATTLARLAIVLLSTLLSLGIAALARDYRAFSHAAGQIEAAADHMRRDGSPSERDAIMALHDYQLARAASPIVPEWLWELKRSSLNALWQAYRAAGPRSPGLGNPG